MSPAPATGVAAAALEPTAFQCPLCGLRFTHGGQVCGCCPLAAGCDLVRCPHCSYTFPRSSRLVDWLCRLFRGREGRNHEPRS